MNATSISAAVTHPNSPPPTISTVFFCFYSRPFRWQPEYIAWWWRNWSIAPNQSIPSPSATRWMWKSIVIEPICATQPHSSYNSIAIVMHSVSFALPWFHRWAWSQATLSIFPHHRRYSSHRSDSSCVRLSDRLFSQFRTPLRQPPIQAPTISANPPQAQTSAHYHSLCFPLCVFHYGFNIKEKGKEINRTIIIEA